MDEMSSSLAEWYLNMEIHDEDISRMPKSDLAFSDVTDAECRFSFNMTSESTLIGSCLLVGGLEDIKSRLQINLKSGMTTFEKLEAILDSLNETVEVFHAADHRNTSSLTLYFLLSNTRISQQCWSMLMLGMHPHQKRYSAPYLPVLKLLSVAFCQMVVSTI